MDPSIQLIDVLAGRLIDELADAEPASNGQAVLFNTGTLATGTHRIAALVTYTNGTTAVLSSTFTK